MGELATKEQGLVVVRGTLTPEGTLVLDERPGLPPGRVEVRLSAIEPAAAGEDLMEVLETIHREQRARGFVPRSREEIDADIEAMRREWGEHDAELDRIRAAGRPEDEPSAAPEEPQ
jgi:hypothetical protein